MTQQIELSYDFRSPYSYLAFTQLSDVAIALWPMNILKVMEKVGNDRLDFVREELASLEKAS